MNGTGNHLRPQKGANDMNLRERAVIPVEEAAEQAGITVEIMKQLLIQKAVPFGVALKSERSSGMRYRYIIFRKRFNKFLQGELS